MTDAVFPEGEWEVADSGTWPASREQIDKLWEAVSLIMEATCQRFDNDP